MGTEERLLPSANDVAVLSFPFFLFESRFSKNFEISLSAPKALRTSGVATSSTNDSTRFFSFHRLLVDTFASTHSHRRTPVPTQTRADTNSRRRRRSRTIGSDFHWLFIPSMIRPSTRWAGRNR